MPTTILNCKGVYPPEGQKKFGAVVGPDSSGQRFRMSVPRESLSLFTAGGTYTVDYDVVPGSQPGQQFYNFLRMANQPAAGMQTAGQAAGGTVQDLEAQAQALLAKAEEAKKAQQQKTQALRAVEHEAELKAAHIFVTGLVGRAAGNGLAEENWPMAAVWAVKAWRAANHELEHPTGLSPSTVAAGGAPVGLSENPGAGLDLNDDVPFAPMRELP